jgi:hypothetical protein
MKFEILEARHLLYLGPAPRFLISFAQPTFKKTRFNRSKKSARSGDPDHSKWSGPRRRRAARDQTALVFADDHAVHVYVV